jgi:hypothetical protein
MEDFIAMTGTDQTTAEYFMSAGRDDLNTALALYNLGNGSEQGLDFSAFAPPGSSPAFFASDSNSGLFGASSQNLFGQQAPQFGGSLFGQQPP